MNRSDGLVGASIRTRARPNRRALCGPRQTRMPPDRIDTSFRDLAEASHDMLRVYCRPMSRKVTARRPQAASIVRRSTRACSTPNIEAILLSDGSGVFEITDGSSEPWRASV